MTKTLNIEGMMCAHCVAHVEKALSALGGVTAAKADLEGKCATVTLAAGVFYPLLGWQLNPMFAAAAMSLSSVCVVGNALRLGRARL